MALPKVKSIVFEIRVPSNGKVLKMRPFTVEEEKILLTAASSESQKFVVENIKQVINNCIIDAPAGFDIDDLAIFDIEYLFVNLRGKSVGNKIELVVEEDGKEYKGVVDVDKIEVVIPEGHEKIIKVDDEISIEMKYPTVDMTTKIDDEKNVDKMLDLFAACIHKVITDDEVLQSGKDFDDKELKEFMMSLPSGVFEKMAQFFQTIPRIEANVEFISKDGSMKIEKTLKGMADFFTS